jgi:hypothetical protein
MADRSKKRLGTRKTPAARRRATKPSAAIRVVDSRPCGLSGLAWVQFRALRWGMV